MIDVERHIIYWREGSQEDWVVGQELVERGRIRHGLFFVHLALEKVLKAHVCRQTRDLAPRIHNLVRLAEQAALPLDQDQQDILLSSTPSISKGGIPNYYLDRRPGRKQRHISIGQQRCSNG